ncbi:hypothetical protein [Paenibacillus sp. 1P03SA]|uniref:hypothetical protein n=1 Tax=Paenibacillus sp. 1P03SA TaxID=3132294 RepID=UPI0039A0C058
MLKKFFDREKKDTSKQQTPVSQVTGSKTKVPSVQEWLPFYDINNGFIWRRDMQVVAAVKIEPINLALLSEKEQGRKVHMLFEVLNSLESDWSWTGLQRPVDLDEYIANQENKRNQESHYMRRRILDSSIREAARTASSGEAIELMFYILLATPINTKKQNLELLNAHNKANEIADNLTEAELISHVCDDQELRELEFIFLNPLQAAFERAPQGSGPYLPPVFATEVSHG